MNLRKRLKKLLSPDPMEESVQKLGKFLSREKTSKSSTLDVIKANVYKFYPVLSKAVTVNRGKGLKGDCKP
jgi:hypothetical protein